MVQKHTMHTAVGSCRGGYKHRYLQTAPKFFILQAYLLCQQQRIVECGCNMHITVLNELWSKLLSNRSVCIGMCIKLHTCTQTNQSCTLIQYKQGSGHETLDSKQAMQSQFHFQTGHTAARGTSHQPPLGPAACFCLI